MRRLIFVSSRCFLSGRRVTRTYGSLVPLKSFAGSSLPYKDWEREAIKFREMEYFRSQVSQKESARRLKHLTSIFRFGDWSIIAFRGLTWITLSMSVVFWKSYSNEKWICPTFSVGSEPSMYMSTIDTLRFCKLNHGGRGNCLIEHCASEKARLKPLQLHYPCPCLLLLHGSHPRRQSSSQLETSFVCFPTFMRGVVGWNQNFN